MPFLRSVIAHKKIKRQKAKKAKSKKDQKRAARVVSQNMLTDWLQVLRQRKAQNENISLFPNDTKKMEINLGLSFNGSCPLRLFAAFNEKAGLLFFSSIQGDFFSYQGLDDRLQVAEV
jgi:hypothetical protein